MLENVNSGSRKILQIKLISCFIFLVLVVLKIRFLLCIIDIFSKYRWVILLKDKKGITITNAFQKILKESNLNKVSEFYNISMKS